MRSYLGKIFSLLMWLRTKIGIHLVATDVVVEQSKAKLGIFVWGAEWIPTQEEIVLIFAKHVYKRSL